ncbi:hypothetical protein PMAYCL1PPCAC_05985 [Pristionchus mayeri]|uniref:Peptidase n=1 Tax=Pristionchus mayeri TaxID=1317129 RepID=A0AAN4ZF30_9BILA|nr:hypothetical protein PMAYCL1PPCAC_05985 [Pristionchus mayeri]
MSNFNWNNFKLEEVATLKKTIKDRLVETSWLKERDYFDLDLLSQFLTIIDEMEVIADLDNVDANLTLWMNLDRIITFNFFENRKRSTGCARFDVIHPFLYLKYEMKEKFSRTLFLEQFRIRYMNGLAFNAFYHHTYNSIHLLAPSFYPALSGNSSTTTVLGFTSLLGHEMFHPFTNSKLAISNSIFNREKECIIDHYRASCNIWTEVRILASDSK